jgi:integrase
MAQTKISTGIYRDEHAYVITVFHNGKRLTPERYPLDTPIKDLKARREEWLRELAEGAKKKAVALTLFAADVQAYLDSLKDDVLHGVDQTRYKSGQTTLLNHWLKTDLATMPREEITSVQVREQLEAWRDAGVAEQTCDNRRQALSNVYTFHGHKSGYNPTRDVERFNPVYDDPRGFDLNVINAVIDAMPDRGRPTKGEARVDVSGAKLRARVIWATGLPPAMLKRITPDKLFLAKKEVWVPRRGKGKKKNRGASARLLPLSDAGVAAFRAFKEANLFGYFDQRGVNAAFVRSMEKQRAAWNKANPDEPYPLPTDFTVYDIRHSWLSDTYKRSKGNMDAVRHLGCHAPNSPVTLRYVQAAMVEVARGVVDGLNAPAPAPAAPPVEAPVAKKSKLRLLKKTA